MEKQTMTVMVDEVLNQMKVAGFSQKTCAGYQRVFNRLIKLANKRGEEFYSEELGIAFVNDDSHKTAKNSKRYWHERTLMYKRCVRFVDMYMKTGAIDFSPDPTPREFPLVSAIFQKSFSDFCILMAKHGLKPNTVDGYRRFVYYFLEYLESKDYEKLEDIQLGDVVTFITFVCSEKYQTTSLGAHLPGLKLFLGMDSKTKSFLNEVPLHLPKKREILQIYTDDEYNKIIDNLEKSPSMSLRNKAITIVALDTGLRAVDICNLKLSNIDWEHNCIHITQSKTGRTHNIPLTDNIGNALADYLLNERPVSDSEYVFLRNAAPYKPLIGHSGIRKVLFHAVDDADIQGKGRIYGTRITRHSTASRMLRNGIPLAVISDALGHGNPNSVLIYLTTDDAKLSECTLPLPKVVAK